MSFVPIGVVNMRGVVSPQTLKDLINVCMCKTTNIYHSSLADNNCLKR